MKITLVCATSLDGFINRSLKAELDWSSRADKELFTRETKRTGVAIMGRNTFDYSLKKKPLVDRRNIVITHHDDLDIENVECVDDELNSLIARLEREGHDEASLIGGGHINTLFAEAGLIDEMLITLTPHLFGTGIPLFANLRKDLELELVSEEPLGTGERLLRYRVKK